jgi:hypothetical protein
LIGHDRDIGATVLALAHAAMARSQRRRINDSGDCYAAAKALAFDISLFRHFMFP